MSVTSAWVGSRCPPIFSSPRLRRTCDSRPLDDLNNLGFAQTNDGRGRRIQLDMSHELYAHMNVNYLKTRLRCRTLITMAVCSTLLRTGEGFGSSRRDYAPDGYYLRSE